MRVLCFDPSLTAWGWALVDPETDHIVDTGVVVTKPSDKKIKMSKGDDLARRYKIIVNALKPLVEQSDLIVTEQPHGSQSYHAAVMVGAVTSMVVTLSQCLSVPVEFFTESECKSLLFGKPASISKNQTKRKISKKYKIDWSGVDYVDFAVADALSVYNAAKVSSPLLSILLKK